MNYTFYYMSIYRTNMSNQQYPRSKLFRDYEEAKIKQEAQQRTKQYPRSRLFRAYEEQRGVYPRSKLFRAYEKVVQPKQNLIWGDDDIDTEFEFVSKNLML